MRAPLRCAIAAELQKHRDDFASMQSITRIPHPCSSHIYIVAKHNKALHALGIAVETLQLASGNRHSAKVGGGSYISDAIYTCNVMVKRYKSYKSGGLGICVLFT